jgi:hypothetical protein
VLTMIDGRAPEHEAVFYVIPKDAREVRLVRILKHIWYELVLGIRRRSLLRPFA